MTTSSEILSYISDTYIGEYDLGLNNNLVITLGLTEIQHVKSYSYNRITPLLTFV